MEFEPIRKLKELFRKPQPAGNGLCYDGEKDGHWQIDREEIPTDQEIVLFPTAFNAPEIIRRQNE